MGESILKNFFSFAKSKQQGNEDIKFPNLKFSNGDFLVFPEVQEKRNAEIIEGNGKFFTKKIEVNVEQSGFSYFLDGIEKKKIISFYRSIPIIYGYTAAVILKRTDKKLHSVNFETNEEKFYVPLKKSSECPEHYFSLEEIKKLGEKNIKNIGEIAKKIHKNSWPILPDEFIQAAHSAIQTSRGDIERNLAKQWLNSNFNDGWLFIDGRLEDKNRENIILNAAGIIKSHHACYFDPQDQYNLYTMEKGSRSPVFQPQNSDRKKENVYSWYLKIHYNKRYGVNDFGLIRIEIPAQKEFLEKVDLISSWILLEIKPIAFPASRWDRMIYPIKYCEDYLKSRSPSWTVIQSLN